MHTAVINIKTEPKIKAQAQHIASQLGLSLSGLINGYLRQLIKNKTVHLSLVKKEPSPYLIQALKESEEDRKAGRVISFKNPDHAINYLDHLIDEQQKTNKD